MIDVTNVDMVEFVKAVYDLSQPQGMGFLHFTPTPLTDAEAKGIIQKDGTVNMDYIKGRSCKMSVRLENGKKYIWDTWYDHTNEQLAQLLERVGVKPTVTLDKEHNASCNCDNCRGRRGGKAR